MTRHFPPPVREATREASAPAAILINAARCWRKARDTGRPVQPSLSRALALHDGAMLAPVLDSLIHFYESALGRPIATGDAMMLSEDEHLLLGLLDGLRFPARIDCAQAIARALDCALSSTRIMMALTLDGTVRTLQ